MKTQKEEQLEMRNIWKKGVWDGWHNLVDEAFDLFDEFAYDDFYVFDIKEKFGSIRFYVFGVPQWVQEKLGEIESRSENICEYCGKPGKVREARGWYKATCDECHQKRIDGEI